MQIKYTAKLSRCRFRPTKCRYFPDTVSLKLRASVATAPIYASLQNLSYILGQQYGRARFVGTDVDVDRKIGLLTKSYGEISQFHQGAGEDSILDTFKLLQDIPNQSLLVIDEVENSLHPQAQRRFVRYLLKLSRVKKLQIILSTANI